MALSFGTLVIYAPVLHYDFVNYDDNDYVTDNPHVLGGFTRENIAWAFTHFHSSNWHPLTWLSHALDVKLWGLNPGGHHITSVVFHATNAALLFLVLTNMTGALWRSGFVAAVFAWHPLHVESVAWVAERKDVLSAFFWILTMAAYLRYVRQPGARWYFLVVALFVCGLMSKSMVVTLPVVLLLLDYWPLQRAALARGALHKWLYLSLEKLPLFGLAFASAFITISIQHRSGAIKSVLELPLPFRVSNAALSYVDYLRESLWPTKLAVFYPLPSSIPLWHVAGALVLLITVTLIVIAIAKPYPHLPFGWFWYICTLVPVIGLIQVGYQSMADRYTYIPLIGLATAGTWGIWDLLKKSRRSDVLATVLLVGASFLMVKACTRQVRYWRNSIILFDHALSVTSINWSAHNNMSNALLGRPGADQAAASHAFEAVRIRPDHPAGYVNLGMAFLRLNKISDAIAVFETALKLKPDWSDAQQDLGRALMLAGRVDEAIPHFYEAVRLHPEHVPTLKALAWIRSTRSTANWRNADEAVRLAERAAKLTNRMDAEALDILAAALAEAGRFDEAIKTGEQARSLALKANQTASASEIAQRLDLYRLGLPYRTRP